MSDYDADITTLLAAASAGDTEATDRLYVLVYEDLRNQARRRLRALPPHATLQPTDLVSEAYIRLFGDGSTPVEWSSRRHFYFAASRAMHDVVVEAARRHGAAKRGGGRDRVPLDDGHADTTPNTPRWTILEIDEALHDLADVDPDSAEVVLLRFFGALTYEQISDATGRSVGRIRGEWTFAQAWLKRRLKAHSGHS
jgi:RNA polymerase sigma factor (TIGR02999 family)